VHLALEGLPAWQEHQRQLAELEERIRRWAAHDLEVRRQREEQDREYAAAVDKAVEAGKPAPPPPPPVASMSRTSELLQQRNQMVEAARRVMDELRPQVAQRARQREQELLAQVLETPVGELAPIRQELEELAATLRNVLLDGQSYRASIDIGEVVEAALDPGSSVLYLMEAGPSIHVDRHGMPPAGRVMVDRDPSPQRMDVLAAARRVDQRRIADANRITQLG
jgi:hypothetical protein